MTRIKTVFEFRPITEGKYLRYAEGDWVADDGEYDLAFVDLDSPSAYSINMPFYENILWSWCKQGKWMAKVSKHPNLNAWHYMTVDDKKTWGKWGDKDRHLNEIAHRSAMNKCCELHRCANGRSVDFQIGDKSIEMGLVRDSATKEVLTFPNAFICMYCGEHDWREEEK